MAHFCYSLRLFEKQSRLWNPLEQCHSRSQGFLLFEYKIWNFLAGCWLLRESTRKWACCEWDSRRNGLFHSDAVRSHTDYQNIQQFHYCSEGNGSSPTDAAPTSCTATAHDAAGHARNDSLWQFHAWFFLLLFLKSISQTEMKYDNFRMMRWIRWSYKQC